MEELVRGFVGTGIFGRLVSPDGAPEGGQFMVPSNDGPLEQRSPALDMAADGRFVVTWSAFEEGDGPFAGLHARVFDPSGTPVGPEIMLPWVTDEEPMGCETAMAEDGSFAVCCSMNEVFCGLFDSGGDAVGDVFLANAFVVGPQGEASLDMTPDGRFVVAWTSFGQEGDGPGVYAQRFDARGAPRGVLSW